MKKAVLTFVLAICVSGSVFATPRGVLYTSVKEPYAVTSAQSYTKSGTGSAISILGLVGTGDASVATIAKDAGIKQVSFVDKRTVSVLGFFRKEIYTVYGN